MQHRQRSADETMNRAGREHGDHGPLHLARLDLLAEILRRAADHQPGDEDREHDEDEHPVKPGADAAEDDFAEHHVDQRHETAERRERVVHRVDRAARSVGRDGGEERGAELCRSALPCLPAKSGEAESPDSAAAPPTTRSAKPAEKERDHRAQIVQPWRRSPAMRPNM